MKDYSSEVKKLEWEEIWKMLRVSPKQREVSHRVRGIEHEAGKISTTQWYADAYPTKAVGYYAEMRKELGDLIAMVRMLCFRMGWNYEEIEGEAKKELLHFITTRMEV